MRAFSNSGRNETTPDRTFYSRASACSAKLLQRAPLIRSDQHQSGQRQRRNAIAARTRRIRIGIAVYVLPLNNPLRVAEEVATVDQLSDGRFDLGIGRSGFVNSYNAYAIPYEAIFEAAAFGRGNPLWGEETERSDIAWPRKSPRTRVSIRTVIAWFSTVTKVLARPYFISICT